MPGQTKLYQRAGSPLIMGHSRYERSAWAEWFLAGLVSTLAVVGAHAVTTLLDPTRPYLHSAMDLVRWLLQPAPGVLTAIVVSGAVVWFGHRAGWRRAWVVAAVIGSVAGVGGMLIGWRVL